MRVWWKVPTVHECLVWNYLVLKAGPSAYNMFSNETLSWRELGTNLQVWFIKLRANSFLHLINLVCCSYLWFHYAIVLMKPETPFIYYLLQSWSWLFILVIAEYEERVRRKRERRKDIAERRIAKAAAAEAARSAIREREEFVAKLEEEKADLERQLVEWEERQAKEVRILI